MLDSPEGVCAGQVGFEYPATSIPFSNSSEQANTSLRYGQPRDDQGRVIARSCQVPSIPSGRGTRVLHRHAGPYNQVPDRS
jgi:hypothetical protein